MKTQTLVINNYTEKRIAKMVIWAIGFSIALYAVFVAMATFSVVRRIALETKAKQLSSEINNLELTYMQESGAIDMVYANSLGFKDVTKTTFAAPDNVAYNAVNNAAKR